MGAAGLVAALAGRPASRWYALLLAAFVTLAFNPRSSGDPGWQLSFAAVVAILVLGAPLREALVHRRVPVAVAEAGAITIAATAATAPLLAFHFGQVSLVSLPANLLAAPAVAPVMWLGMISAGVAQVSVTVAALPAAVAACPLAYVEWLAAAAAAVPQAAVGVHVGSPAGVVAIYTGLGIAAAIVVTLPRARPAVAVTAVVAAALAWLSARPPPPLRAHGLTVSFLDVGQGDATLIQHDRAAILVDTGPPHGPILERLRRAGVAAARRAGHHPRPGRSRGRSRRRPGPDAGRPRARRRGGRRRRSRSAGDRGGRGAGGRAPCDPGRRPGHPRRTAHARVSCGPTARPSPGTPASIPTTARSSRTCATAPFDLLLPADAESDVTPRSTCRRSTR